MPRRRSTITRRATWITIVVCASLANGSISTSAQSATPVPEIPPASLCTVETPSFAELTAIIATPVADNATPVSSRDGGTFPNGTPADPTALASIQDAAREYVACFNLGGPLRAYGLYTNSYLQHIFQKEGGLTQSRYDELAKRVPAADGSEAVTFLRVEDVRLYADGSAGATLIVRFPWIPVDKLYFFTFARKGDAWRISEILGEINFSVP